MPKLSVILTVYNTLPYLKKCLDSILTQTFSDFELICVDNHSDDGSTEILKQYAKSDSRVSYYQTPVHVRAAETREYGRCIAKGEFITYVDADDSLKQGMYTHMFQEQAKQNADIVACNYDMVFANQVIPFYSNMHNETVDMKTMGYTEYFYRYFCMNKPNNYLWSRIIRHEIIANHNIKFHPVDISEDTIFTMLCACFSKKIVHVSNSYYNYFQRDESTVRNTIRKKNIADSFVYAFGTVEKYVREHGLSEKFQDIFPLYAFTRVRSILFYKQLVGNSEAAAYEDIRRAVKGSSIPRYLNQALNDGYIRQYVQIQQLPDDAMEKIQFIIQQCLINQEVGT